MTPTVVFWTRIAVWLLMGYTAFTYARSASKRGYLMPRDGKNFRALGGDLLSLAFGAFAWYMLETNFQAPIDAVMQNRDRSLAGLRYTDSRTGSERSLEEWRGKLVILNVWATWCPPCRREMPDLQRIDSVFSASGAAVVALSDEDPATVREFVDKNDYRFASGTFTSMPSSIASIGSRPFTILIDKEGRVSDMVVGARGYDFFRRWVEDALKEKSN